MTDKGSVRGGFGEILPQFTENPREFLETDRAFNFGLGDLREVKGLDDLLADSCSGGVNLGMLETLPGTQGLHDLNADLAAIDASELGRATRPEDVLLCCGACDGLVLSLLSSTIPGDGIAFPVPAFPYWWVFSGTGREIFPLYFENARAYQASFGDRVREAIRENPSIRAVVLNAPQNPMGVSVEDQQLAMLQTLAEEGLAIIVDDVARSFEDSSSGWWRVLDPDLVMVVNSFTKRYAVPGLRLGWMRARGESLLRARDIASNWRVGVATPVAEWGLRIVEALGRGDLVAQEVRRRREILVRTVSRRGGAFPQIGTQGHGVYAPVDCRCDKVGDPGPMLRVAAAKAGVLLMGSQFLFPPDFEVDASRWMLRLSIAGESRVEEGLGRLYEIGDWFLEGSGRNL